jgi:hypothetical protein
MEVSPEVSHGRHTAQSLTGLDVGGFSLPQRADPSRVGATATPTSPDLLPINGLLTLRFSLRRAAASAAQATSLLQRNGLCRAERTSAGSLPR